MRDSNEHYLVFKNYGMTNYRMIRKLADLNAVQDRKLFVVTGSTTTLAGRRKLKRSLKESGNGILLCTQQCLPSSVNFEFVNKIIIPELHYNARMSQFYMRFVRFTSTEWKDIYFVTYSGSIESNQMQMVLAKEKLNLYMKGQDVNLDEIYDRFGVDYDLMSLLMSREKDKDGHFAISWENKALHDSLDNFLLGRMVRMFYNSTKRMFHCLHRQSSRPRQSCSEWVSKFWMLSEIVAVVSCRHTYGTSERSGT